MLAKSFARIHWQNLANFGIPALEFTDQDDYDRIERGDVLVVAGVREALANGDTLIVRNDTKNEDYQVRHRLSGKQIEAVLAGGVIPLLAAGHQPA